MLRLVAALAIVLLTSRCVRVEPPAPLPSYAVFCVLSPDDDQLVAALSRVVPVGERFLLDSAVSLPDADVTIAGRSRTVRLRYNAAKKRYEALNGGFVVPRETYRLRVQLPGNDRLEASCTVPSACPPIEVRGGKSGDDYVFGVSWVDVAGEENAYFLSASVEAGGSSQSPNGPTAIVQRLVSWGNSFNPRVFTTDANQDGQRLFSPDGTVRQAFPVSDSLVVQVVLENMDPDYFSYSQKILTQRTSDDGLIDRFKEPVLVPTNVENGLGIFGAFTRRTARLRVN